MFALTVEQLSRLEYKPTKKEEMKASKKLAERMTRDFESEKTNAPGAFRSPVAARRKFNRLNQIFGTGARRGSLTSTTSSTSSGGSSVKSSFSGGT